MNDLEEQISGAEVCSLWQNIRLSSCQVILLEEEETRTWMVLPCGQQEMQWLSSTERIES